VNATRPIPAPSPAMATPAPIMTFWSTIWSEEEDENDVVDLVVICFLLVVVVVDFCGTKAYPDAELMDDARMAVAIVIDFIVATVIVIVIVIVAFDCVACYLCQYEIRYVWMACQ